jgi:hypothetical protein
MVRLALRGAFQDMDTIRVGLVLVNSNSHLPSIYSSIIQFHFSDHVTAESNPNPQSSDFGPKRLLVPKSRIVERSHGTSASERNCGAIAKRHVASSGVARAVSDPV